MPLVSTRGLVLQTFPYSETSKVLRLLTPAHGVCSVIAKGAQRPKSRFGGLLEPFTEGDALIFLKENRELHTLSGFDLVKSRQSLGRDLVAFSGASLIAELVLHFGTAEAQPQLFRGVSAALDRIVSAAPHLLPETVIADLWLLIATLGFRPQTERCVTCDQEVDPEQDARFDVEAGGTACPRCRPHGRPLDPTSLDELRSMISGYTAIRPFRNPGLQQSLVQSFLTTHLAREHGLRSLTFFLQQIG